GGIDDADLVRRFAVALSGCRAGLFAGVLTASTVALARGSGTSEVAVMTPVVNRSIESDSRLVGWLSTMRVIRLDCGPGRCFADLVADVQEQVIDALDH